MGKSKLFVFRFEKMIFYVKTLTGTTITIDLGEDATVADVKELIIREEGIDYNQQRLLASGKVLDDKKTVKDYDIKEGAVVDLVINMQGGATSTMDPAIVELSKKYNHDKKVCRKCYATLPPRAKKCRKRACGHWPDIRPRKAIKGGK